MGERQTKKQKNVENRLKDYSSLEVEKLFESLGTSYSGISVVDVDDKLKEYGKNSIEIKNNNTIFRKIKEAVINPFNIVLIVVAVITLFTDVILSEQKDYATFALIVSIIFISAIISLKEQIKSDNAAQKLKKMITNKMEVIRDEVQSTIDVENIVPGDIVKLSSGDMIPGDVRFLEVKDLFIDQASLTGESNPIEKFSVCKEYDSVTDISNIGFMGTNIVSGSALAIVLTTGNNTYFGSMAKSLYSVNEKNTFEKGIDDISKLLIKFMLVMVPIILAINLFTKIMYGSL